MDQSVVRELQDREAWALAVFAAAVSAVIVRNVEIAVIAFVGTLGVRCLVGVVLHGTHPPTLYRFPDLSREDTSVAWYVYRGRGDPAIARRTGLALRGVRESVRRVMKIWLTRREQIADHVADILGEAPVHLAPRKRSREWLGETGWGIGVTAVGIGILALSPDTAVLGGMRTWLGLGLAAGGVIFVAVSTIT